MGEVVESVRKGADTMNEITLASEQQSSGIEQINVATNQMDEMTQQNAALAEQAAAAAASRREQAQALLVQVGQFTVAGSTAHGLTGGTGGAGRRLAAAAPLKLPY